MSSADLIQAVGRATTLVDLLRVRAEHQADRLACLFLRDGEVEAGRLTYGQLDQKARAIAARLQSLNAAGIRALLLFPTGLEFVAAFFGCLYAGVLAVPCFPPRRNRVDARLQSILSDSGATVALTTGSLLADSDSWLSRMPGLKPLSWLATDAVGDDAADWHRPDVSGETLAFLQYTSGSTSSPKGVMVSHYNLLHNMGHLDCGWDHGEGSVMVTWLPIFHDMGLIYGLLVPVFKGFPACMLPPASFLQRPMRWLNAISAYRGTHSAAPNFAYDLCVRSATDEDKRALDLSSWVMTLNAAEPVREDTMRRFEDCFVSCGFNPKTFCPGFGLAEATLKVTALPRDTGRTVLYLDAGKLALNQAVEADASLPAVLPVVGCGPRVDDTRVAIVDPETMAELPEDRVGEIWVSGSTMAAGYWNKPAETEATFHAHLAGGGAAKFMRTGDLGFLHAGQLYVTGRLKDMIIVHGLNHYPHDIELTVERSHPSLRPGGGAAFSVAADGVERLVVLQEVERTALRRFNVDEVAEQVRRAVFEEHGLSIQALIFIRTGTILKTTSGKIQRHACRKAYLAGQLEIVGEWHAASLSADRSVQDSGSAPGRTAGEIRDWLTVRIAEACGLPASAISQDRPFSAYGLDSIGVVRLADRLGIWLGRAVPPTVAYDYPTVRAVAQFLAPATEDRCRVVDSGEQPIPPSAVAVIGMACRFPGADDIEAFWKLLAGGVDAIAEVTPVLRWDQASVGSSVSRWGGFVEGVDLFDAGFFGISPREAEKMDPQQRLLLETAWHALEHAGLRPAEIAGSRTGVFIGISNSDYMRLQFDGKPAGLDVYAGTGNALSIAANRLSYVLDLNGPSMAVDTACSSSLVAVHLACRSLACGESSLALAGGVNLILAPEWTTVFSRAGMMASDGRCKTFDAAADGYVRGEGVGVVVLKRLDDAVREGDPILAVIRGSAINQDGRSNGITAPNGPAQKAVVRSALAAAAVTPDLVSYVEAHGTGTALGDPIEVNSLREVLLTGRASDRPCMIGSVKTNIGHLEAAAGIAGLIKVILSLEHGLVPPNLHFNRLNPHISLGDGQLSIPVRATDWPAIDGRRIAGVSSFGFGGTNSHVIVESFAGGGCVGRKPRLPLTVFKRERYWLEGRPGQSDLNILYEVTWKKCDVAGAGALCQVPAAAGMQGAGNQAGVWLVLSDKSGFGEKLVCALEKAGQQAVMVIPPDGPAGDGSFAGLIDDAVVRAGRPLAGIVYLRNLDVSEIGMPFDVDVHERTGCAAVLKLVQELAGMSMNTPARVWVITADTVPAGDSAAVSAEHSALIGLGRVIALEYPGLWGGIIDVNRAGDATSVAAELRHGSDEGLVACRDAGRYVPRLVRKALPKRPTVELDPDGLYLITGGCGALGLRTAVWLAEKGARRLCLLGRSGANAQAEDVLKGLRAKGVLVAVECADVSNFSELARVFESVAQGGRAVRGIIHAAGVIDDATIQRMDWLRFARVMKPKVQGAWNLHILSRGLDLDFFVMFSSVASLLGSAGQSNYAAANAFMDGLARSRRAAGLPALSINWGLWQDEGMAGRLDGSAKDRLVARGLHSIGVGQGLDVLGALLASGNDCEANVAVLRMDWPVFCRAAGAGLPLLSELNSVSGMAGGAAAVAAGGTVAERLMAAENRGRFVAGYVRELLASILKTDPERLDDARRGFFTMGLDSLMAVELKNRLEKDFGRRFPATVAFEHSSLEALAAHLLSCCATPGCEAAVECERSRNPLPGLDEIRNLSDAETSALIDTELELLLK